MYNTSKSIIINSNYRSTGTHSNFNYDIPELSNDKYDRVVCVSALIQKSYYLIQTGVNDTFNLKENSTTVTITLSPGNYNITNLKTIVGQKLTTASPTGLTYTLTYPSSSQVDTGKLTFTCTGVINPQLIFGENSCYEILGFADGSTNTFSANSLTSTNVVKLQKEDCIKIASNICDEGILCTILGNGEQNYSSIVYKCIDLQLQSRELKHRGSSTYSFALVNENNLPIETNGLNIVIEILAFKNSYELFTNTARMVQGYIKYNILDQKNNILN